MNVLIVSGDYPPRSGGIAVYGGQLAEHLARRPEVDRVSVLALGDWPRGREEDGGCLIYREPARGFLGLGLVVAGLIRRLRPDVIHVLTVFPEGFWAALAARLTGRPLFISLYGTEVTATGGSLMTRLAKKTALRLAEGLFPISRVAVRAVEERFGLRDRPMTVVWPGLTEPEPPAPGDPGRESLGLDPDDFVVLTVTRLVARKGVDLLIQALAGLPERIKLVVVGQGWDRGRLEDLARREGLAGRVVFTGFVPRTGPYYRLADVFVLASIEDRASGDVEGFGIVLVEAQAQGLPVIGTACGGIPEAFEDGLTGLLVPPGDAEALGRAIARLAGDRDLRGRLGAAGPDLVARRYDWDRNAALFLEAYRAARGG